MIIEGRQERVLKLSFNARWLWPALVVVLSAGILRSFFEPLAWASIFAVATWPIYRRFAQRLPARVASNATPLLFTLLVSLFVLGPMVFAFGALVSEAHRWIDQIVAADKTGSPLPPGWRPCPWSAPSWPSVGRRN